MIEPYSSSKRERKISLVSVHFFHKRPICIEIFYVVDVQGTSRGDALV